MLNIQCFSVKNIENFNKNSYFNKRLNRPIKAITLLALFLSIGCRRDTNIDETTKTNLYKNQKSGKEENIFDGNIIKKTKKEDEDMGYIGGDPGPSHYELGIRVSLDDNVIYDRCSECHIDYKRITFLEMLPDEGYFTPYLKNLKKLLYVKEDPRLAQELLDVAMSFIFRSSPMPPNSMGYTKRGNVFINTDNLLKFLFDKGAVFHLEYFKFVFKYNDSLSSGRVRKKLEWIAMFLSWGSEINIARYDKTSIINYINKAATIIGNDRLRPYTFNKDYREEILKDDKDDKRKFDFDIVDYLEVGEKKILENIKKYKKEKFFYKKKGNKEQMEHYSKLLRASIKKTYGPNYDKETNTFSSPPAKVLDKLEHDFFERLCKELVKQKQKKPLDKKFLDLILHYGLKDKKLIKELKARVAGNKVEKFSWMDDVGL